ncbi:hypothetical protein [Salinisphaera sp. LB1]|uniref:hypothetical protein n=1 Tax=Salinisphaera sp. LB1 TaxID=2183911 RepID=UPI0011AB375F|nr:hypothetical protein [Salinisphaera sp. LB1]
MSVRDADRPAQTQIGQPGRQLSLYDRPYRRAIAMYIKSPTFHTYVLLGRSIGAHSPSIIRLLYKFADLCMIVFSMTQQKATALSTASIPETRKAITRLLNHANSGVTMPSAVATAEPAQCH